MGTRIGWLNRSVLFHKETGVLISGIDSRPKRSDSMANIPAGMSADLLWRVAAGKPKRKGSARFIEPTCHLSDLTPRLLPRTWRFPLTERLSKVPETRAAKSMRPPRV